MGDGMTRFSPRMGSWVGDTSGVVPGRMSLMLLVLSLAIYIPVWDVIPAAGLGAEDADWYSVVYVCSTWNTN